MRQITFKNIETSNSWCIVKESEAVNGILNEIPLNEFYDLMDSRVNKFTRSWVSELGNRRVGFTSSKPLEIGTWTYGDKCIYTFKPSEKISYLIGQIVTIRVAHEWQKGLGWSNYSAAEYTIEAMSNTGILARRESNSLEMIKVTNEDLDNGRFEVWIRFNYEYYNYAYWKQPKSNNEK